MKNLPLSKTGSGFSGTRRYYHRSGSTERSWDEWVGDGDSKSHGKKNRRKIMAIVGGALVLLSIVGGLLNELI